MSTTQRFAVPGVSCGHCKTAIETELATVAGVETASVDVAAKTVTVIGEADADTLIAAIDNAGYDATSI